ncbi:unnamed protein product [Heligmosomoides polygyrus]|uniref:DOMON domain-containing protein n=1 Tax=Heligmosomoides polygyrus TaxID=6339 RepID=A0A183F4V4_HELPZ|nr:unnamed protein product [Heligmosomoides polygyrus]
MSLEMLIKTTSSSICALVLYVCCVSYAFQCCPPPRDGPKHFGEVKLSWKNADDTQDFEASIAFNFRNGKPTFIRFGKRAQPSFIRFGRAQPSFIRFGRRAPDSVMEPNHLRTEVVSSLENEILSLSKMGDIPQSSNTSCQ